jgi:aminoglycoside 6'-N-acetyltransferase I
LTNVEIRTGSRTDVEPLSHLLAALWPESTAEEHGRELVSKLSGEAAGNLPLVIFVAEAADGTLVGFMEAGLRSHADGCDTRQPVGFVEGWYVMEGYRRSGVGSRLLTEAENWARRHGCTEMASDTWLDHDLSQRVHQALGFVEVDRCVHYRKAL